MTKCVLVTVKDMMQTVDLNFKNNDHGKLLGGDVTIIGQIETDSCPIIFIANDQMMKDENFNKVNLHILPEPMNEETVYGDMIILKMDGGKPYDITDDEYRSFIDSLL